MYIDEVGHLSAHNRHWIQFSSSIGNTLSVFVKMCIGHTLTHFPQFTHEEALRNTTLSPKTKSAPLWRIGMPSEYPITVISVNGSQWVQFPVESFCKQPCLEHIQLIRSGFIVTIHQHPRACTVKTTARKLTGYNSAFSFDDFLQGFMICPKNGRQRVENMKTFFPSIFCSETNL